MPAYPTRHCRFRTLAAVAKRPAPGRMRSADR